MEPVVAHSANPYLPATATWIYDQIRALKRHRPIVLTQTRQNLDRFPTETVLSAEDISPVRRTTLRLTRKMRGTYAGYENWLREYNAALIHAHFGQEGYRCLSAKQRTDIPLITTFYGLDVSALPRQKNGKNGTNDSLPKATSSWLKDPSWANNSSHWDALPTG